MDKKSTLITTIIVFILALTIFVLGSIPKSNTAKLLGFNQQNSIPKQLYRVYLSGQSIGVIESKQELENYIDKKQEQLKKKYNVEKVYAPNDLDIISEITYNETVSTVEEIYKKIEEIKGASSFTIDGYKIVIKGLEKEEDGAIIKTEDQIIYTINKEIFEEAVRKTITAFIDNETYDAYLNDTQKEIAENETGSIIENLYIQNKITIKKEKIPTGDKIYQTEEELSKYLLFGTLDEQENYIVQAGDTIEDIAYNNKLSTEEFLIANTNFKSSSDLLYPGQKVKLGLITPQFDLVEVKYVVSKQVIQKQTVYKNDATQYVGYEKVEEEGSDGLALVGETINSVNGEINDMIRISYTELTPAVNKVIVRGTKKKEIISGGSLGSQTDVPVGIGSWVWPTNAPYTISSPYGWRWGKLHEAVDITGPGYGSPIKAANNGVVVQSNYNNYNGNWIVIKHSNNYYTYYGHLAKRYKQVGDVVMAGDRIGTMGETGFATGVHLHFGVYNGYPYRGGVAFNPMKLYR